jgi:hypothetical protein
MTLALVVTLLGILLVYAGVTGRPLSRLVFGTADPPQSNKSLSQ